VPCARDGTRARMPRPPAGGAAVKLRIYVGEASRACECKGEGELSDLELKIMKDRPKQSHAKRDKLLARAKLSRLKVCNERSISHLRGRREIC